MGEEESYVDQLKKQYREEIRTYQGGGDTFFSNQTADRPTRTSYLFGALVTGLFTVIVFWFFSVPMILSTLFASYSYYGLDLGVRLFGLGFGSAIPIGMVLMTRYLIKRAKVTI